MAFPLINPQPMFLDSSGSPLSDGTIEFRNPDTNAFINSFPTAGDADAQTNANVNPLILNASGEPPNGLYLEDGVKYKVILKDSDGVTQWTQDDVRCPTYLPDLAVTDGNFIVGNGTTWVAESGATARASMGANDAANLTTGTIPAARIAASGVTQHQAALALNATQTATTRSTSSTLAIRQLHALAAGATVDSGTQGEWVAVYNDTAGDLTLTQGAGVTLRLAGTATTGNRTLALRTLAVIYYNTTTDVIVSGGGVS